ncbi:Bor family protein [Psychrobacter sp. JCM 18900]|uniref:Bor family protein n=1 Tax=Psychrobacter sp. JCM 18900 TaxID=1298608 RepID=UPI0021C40B5E|nr:Bor family protein [Psychrobacter sp. JCM 18900]
MGQEQTVNAAEVCGGAQNVAKVQTVQEAKDIALGLVTFGIYTPRTAKVFCR